MIKSKRVRLTGHVASVGRREMHIGFWWGNQKKIDHLENLDLDGRIILR
jgi:hypothetical protein